MLIQCPECGKEISDKAVSCPNCGCPSSQWAQEIEDDLFSVKETNQSVIETPEEISVPCSNKKPLSFKKLFLGLLGGSAIGLIVIVLILLANFQSPALEQLPSTPAPQYSAAPTPHHSAAPSQNNSSGIYTSGSSSYSSSRYDDDDISSGLYVLAKKAVSNHLKAPSTADFCDWNECEFAKGEGNTYIMTGYVDAENSYGAKLRSTWGIMAELNGEKLTMIFVIIDGETYFD